MSGHSHAKKIKHQKEATDQKRGQVFSKLAKELEIAAKDGGDPVFNHKLRIVIEKAREMNMPTENIDRAIKRGTGELEGLKLEEVLFEAYGPGGVAIIVKGITDNKNRTLGGVKQILNQNGGKLVGEGGVRWMFERRVSQEGSLEWAAKQDIDIPEKDREACQKLFEALDDNDDVQKVYSNLKEQA